MIPGDVRLLACKDLFVTQSSLTGEAFPVEKFETAGAWARITPRIELKNVCFLGTSVESGTAHGVVVTTGKNTYLGSMASLHPRQNRRKPASIAASTNSPGS